MSGEMTRSGAQTGGESALGARSARDANAAGSALLVDLYELTMGDSYVAEGMAEQPATFELTFRRLPPGWGYFVAAGLADTLSYLEGFRFDDGELAYLESTGLFGAAFLDRLGRLRFTGQVRAMAEGTVFFPGEPVLEVTAPLLEAQLVETVVLNEVHLQSLIASKAARCVDAAAGRRLVEFGLRRTHGGEAGLKVARASYLAGFDATSNVLAGRIFGIPTAGTMAHSFVECFEDEQAAFEAFLRTHPNGSTLVIDTYDTVEGARLAARASRALADRGVRLGGVRLDSGDLLELAKSVRSVLDEAGLADVVIFASGNLDEREIARLLAGGAPIDGFGVGSRLGVPADSPFLDATYKLVAVDGRPVLKLSAGKATLPGAKQVWRHIRGARFAHDVIALAGEPGPQGAVPLLAPAMGGGRQLEPESLATARERAAEQRAALPPAHRRLDAEEYLAELSPEVVALRDAITRRVGSREGPPRRALP
jgi:nicotinate phosphoribosyltransferase